MYVQQLDFEIVETGNPKTIVFIDSSNYFEEPELPVLDIIPPYFNQIFRATITARQVNTLNSSTIGLTAFVPSDCPLDFPDGIYKFTYGICPYVLNVTKYRVRTTQLDEKLNMIYKTLECNLYSNESVQRELLQIYLAKESAKANASLFYLQNAESDFRIATDKTDILYDKIVSNGLSLSK
jgi:hypothetical protein